MPSALSSLAFAALALFHATATLHSILALALAFSGAFTASAGSHLALALARIHHCLLVLVGRILGDTLLIYLGNEIGPGCHIVLFYIIISIDL